MDERRPLPEDIDEQLLLGVAAQVPAGADAIKARLMQRIAAERRPQAPGEPVAATADPGIAADAAGLLTVRSEAGDWRRFLPGVSIKVLRREAEILTYLLKLEPGAAILPHDHPEDEECIVVSGEARLGDLVLRAGDYHCAPKGTPHGVIRSESGAVLFLRGAVPAASQVRWLGLDTLGALAPATLRRFVDRW